jgi:hypothetical protein
VIREAIDQFAAEHDGVLPGSDGSQTMFKADLQNYLRGEDFPICPVGEAKNGEVRMLAGSGSFASGIGATATTHSWVYQYQIGEFHVNSTASANDGVATYDEF